MYSTNCVHSLLCHLGSRSGKGDGCISATYRSGRCGQTTTPVFVGNGKTGSPDVAQVPTHEQLGPHGASNPEHSGIGFVLHTHHATMFPSHREPVHFSQSGKCDECA